MNLSALKALQARIRQATGPDCTLDTAILVALLGEYVGAEWDRHGAPLTTYPEGLGACVGLMHERFPGCAWERSQRGRFRIYYGWLEHLQLWRAADANPLANDCLTFIDAIISATIAQLEAREETNA
jgi:hypothetical protein